MEIFIILGGIAFLFAFLDLSKRVSRLENALQSGHASKHAHPTKKDDWFEEVRKPAHAKQSQATPHKPIGDRFVKWITEDWLIKLGALMLLLGFGWFATYAFAHNWIGPMGRITLGIVAGIGILVFGWLRMKKYENQGSIFLVLGSTVVLLTTFAGRELYDLFTPSSALVVMFLSTVFVGVASVVYKRKSLAFAGLILASIAPLFTNSPEPNHIALFAYVLVVIAGTIWVTALTQQRSLTIGALVVFWLYSIPYLFGYAHSYIDVLILFEYVCAALLFASNAGGILKSFNKKPIADMIAAMGNGLLLTAWILVAIPDHLQSMVIVVWMLVFVVAAFVLFKVTDKVEVLYAYLAVGVMMLGAATATELSGPALTIAYTIEAALVPWIIYITTKKIMPAFRASLLLVIPIILSFESIASKAWEKKVLHQDFAVLAVITLVLCAAGALFYAHKARHKTAVHVWFLSIGSAYGYTLLWLSLHAGIEKYDTATTVAMIVYTLIGLGAYMYGRIQSSSAIQRYGAVMLGIVTARLLLVDVWDMVLSARIITFFIIGILFMSTAFVKQKK